MHSYFDHNATSALHPEVLDAKISGGEQERNRRAGTENVVMIAGMGKAARIAALEIEHKRHHLSQLRVLFEAKLATIPGVVIYGQNADRLPNTTYFSVPYYHGETIANGTGQGRIRASEWLGLS